MPKTVPMKGKAKGKAKAKGKSKTLKFVPSEHAPEVEGHSENALVVTKPRAPSLRARVLKQLEEKTLDEVIGEWRQKGVELDEQIDHKSKAVAEAMQKETEAQNHFSEVQEEVAAAEENELEAMNYCKSFAAKRAGSTKAKEKARKDLIEAKQALELAVIMAQNRETMKELEQKRRAAQESAEAAKRRLTEQKQVEKEALDATRKALMEQKEQAMAEKEALTPQANAGRIDDGDTQAMRPPTEQSS